MLSCEPDSGLNIALADLSELAKSGVYLLKHKGEVVYVGQSVNVRKRIGEHISEGAKIFDSVTFHSCEPARLAIAEQILIRRLAPKYNRCATARHSQMLYAAQRGTGSDAIPLAGPVTDDQAADFLSMTAEAFADLKASGGIKHRRVGRDRKRLEHFTIEQLRQFKAGMATV